VFSNEFKHSKFVAYKVKDAIVDQFREKTGNRPNIRIVNPDIQLHIHVAEYDCTLALDSSGESLHRRGYRQEAVEAPLNEVLAAGIILQTGWRGECDLIDPMCGSGTFAVEAALIARGIAPGVFRKEYAFEKWPDFDSELFERIYEDDSNEKEFEHHIYGYDNNRQAVEIATRNVKAAGLSKDVTITLQDFKDFTQPKERSVIITNPPYTLFVPMVERAMAICNKKVAMLLPLRYLTSKERFEVFKKYPPKYVYVYIERICIAKNGKFEEYDAGANMEMYAWYVWEKGFEGEPTLRWIHNDR
jgi:23S rRNA G2445 N2-methylase RlmL